jgi:8-oxo-dGTP diphosphatase
VTVDALVFRFFKRRLEIALIRRDHYPYEGMWALPGGFIGMEESLEEACARELEEEAGIKAAGLRQLGAYGQPHRDPRTRIVAVAFYGFAAPGNSSIRAGDDAREARWWAARGLPEMAFDHAQIIGDALERIRREACFGLEHCRMLGERFGRGDFVALHAEIFGGEYDADGFFSALVKRGKIRRARGGKYSLVS